MPLFVTKYIQISDICQVRLDFFKVVLQQPTSTTGSCTNTYTTITPGATTVTAYNRPPALCGTLTDQHCTKTTLLSFWTTNIFNSYRYHILLRLISFIYSYEPHFYILVYIDSGRTVSTIATIKFTLASASDNYWRVCNFSSHAKLFINAWILISIVY